MLLGEKADSFIHEWNSKVEKGVTTDQSYFYTARQQGTNRVARKTNSGGSALVMAEDMWSDCKRIAAGDTTASFSLITEIDGQ